MKIKKDFITNSSSSSFIVAWDKEIKCFEDVYKFIPNIEKAMAVLQDSKNQTPLKTDILNYSNTIKRIHSVIRSGTFDGYLSLSYDDIIKNDDYRKRYKLWKCIREENRKISLKLAKQFVKENIDKVFYIFHYSDNNGEFWSQMEHDGIFYELPFIHVSHH